MARGRGRAWRVVAEEAVALGTGEGLARELKADEAVGGLVTRWDAREAGKVVNHDEVEASRPSHCPACGLAARDQHRIRLQGHGKRTRTVWGPASAGEKGAFKDVSVRRYRCVDCMAARVVQPQGLAPKMRYSLAAVTLALWLWGVVGWPAVKVRGRVSPLGIHGASDAGRWRSLRRWVQRAEVLLGLSFEGEATVREQAARIVQLVFARGPTDACGEARVMAGAHVA